MVIRSFFFVLSVLVFISVAPHPASADDKDFIVFDVRKTLALTDTDPVYRDYYVNIGTESGVRAGSILAVYRRMPVIDYYRNKAQGDLVIPVGHLKVIHSQKTMSVCRIASIASEKQIPVVEYETVMMGDRVEISGDQEAPQATKPQVQNKDQSADEAAQNDDAVTGDGARQPAAAPAATVDTPAQSQPAKKLKPKQAKPSVKAIPLPAQAALSPKVHAI